MAIDYGLKTFLEFYSKEFIEFIYRLGILKRADRIKSYGPIELMVQERPLRIDFVMAVGEAYIIIEGKGEGDYITSEDLYRLLLYSVGLAKKESVPLTEMNKRIITIIITPSTRNIKVPISKTRPGVYLVDIPTITYLLVVDELKLEPQILWLKVLSKEGRLELYGHALRKRYLKIYGNSLIDIFYL